MNTLPIVHFLWNSICLWGPTIERGRHVGRRDSVELHHYTICILIEAATYLQHITWSKYRCQRKGNDYLASTSTGD